MPTVTTNRNRPPPRPSRAETIGSQEELTRFLEAIRHDSSLQRIHGNEGTDPVAIAEEARFSFARAELLRAQALRVLSLNDEESEAVAGGTGSDSRDYAVPTSWGCWDSNQPSPPLT